METLRLDRFYMWKDCTLGVVTDKNKEIICYSLELPWLDNKPEISCIPPGTYTVSINNGEKKGFRLNNVIGRRDILIHIGNTVKDSKGCLIWGSSAGKLGGIDGVRDSTVTINSLLQKYPMGFILEIRNL